MREAAYKERKTEAEANHLFILVTPKTVQIIWMSAKYCLNTNEFKMLLINETKSLFAQRARSDVK